MRSGFRSRSGTGIAPIASEDFTGIMTLAIRGITLKSTDLTGKAATDAIEEAVEKDNEEGEDEEDTVAGKHVVLYEEVVLVTVDLQHLRRFPHSRTNVTRYRLQYRPLDQHSRKR